MPRRPLLTRTDVTVLTAAAVACVALVLLQGPSLVQASNVLGVAVFGLLVWRLVSTWPQLTVLEHALTMLLATSPLVGAVASWGLLSIAGSLDPNPWLWLIMAHRAACLVLVVYWNRWLGRRTSPFRRDPMPCAAT